MKLLLFSGSLISLVILLQPSKSIGDETQQTQAIPESTKVLANANNEFALDLYSRIQGKDGNLVISPYCIWNALGMTYAGAGGKTEEEIATVLRLPRSRNPLRSGFTAAPRQHGAKAEFVMANSLWGQHGVEFRKEFLSILHDAYGAQITAVDFTKNPMIACQAINDWVSQSTKNKIGKIVEPDMVGRDTTLLLATAVYFRADWLNPFSKDFTKDLPFHLASGEKKSLPHMLKYISSKYYEETGLQVLEIPYADRRFSFITILPRESKDMPAVEKRLSVSWLNETLVRMKPHVVELTLPRFKIESSLRLSSALRDAGMPLAFSYKADFSGIINDKMPLYLREVVHKSILEVDEKGAEAASATAVVAAQIVSRPAAPLPTARFLADHPFIVIVRDDFTGTILFLGRVSAPG